MSNTIVLSKETRQLLLTASKINNSIRIEAGNVIRTMSPTESVFMEAKVAETFPEEFRIYELNRFLQVVGMVDGAELTFSGGNSVQIKADRTKVDYKFSNAEFAVHPGQTIELPSQELRARVTQEDLDNIRKLASVFGHNVMAFKASGGTVEMITTTPELGDAATETRIELTGAEVTQDGFYRVMIGNLVLPPGDYDLTVCASGLAEFSHVNGAVKVYVGLEGDPEAI